MKWISPEGLGISVFFLAVTVSAVLFIIKILEDADDDRGHR